MTAMTFSQALAAIATVEKAWDESKHPRERDGKGGKKDGQFAPGKGGGSAKRGAKSKRKKKSLATLRREDREHRAKSSPGWLSRGVGGNPPVPDWKALLRG